MDANGCITLKAETELESFALSCWSARAIAYSEFPNPNSEYSIRGRYLLIDASAPE